MGKSLTLAVIGGDERQVFLASLALADGHAVRTFALDRANIEGAAICSDARPRHAGRWLAARTACADGD